MENKVSVWKANLTNGLILGLVGIVYSLVVYFLDLTFNNAQGYIFLLIEAVILFFLLKSYRDNVKFGMITYGESLGAGVVICLYYSLIMAVFIYLLYTVIDTELVAKQLAFAEETMQKKGLPQESIDMAMKMQEKFMKPAIMAPFGIIMNMFFGLVLSLLVSIFIRKEGNPLVDTPSNQ
jgi:hypothetical protein